MKEQTREEPKILAAAERQMHAWAMTEKLKDQVAQQEAETRLAPRALRYITISREAGAGASEIGKSLGQRLGWEVFDKNLLDQVADRFHLSRMMLDLVDETRSSWVYDVLGTWMDRKLVPHEKYVTHLSCVVLAAAARGPAVFVGRGARFLLPRQQVLAVRIVASPKYRLRKIVEQTGMNENDARRFMQDVDEGCRHFVERFFRRDITDPHHYDLVINVERCGRQGTVEEILAMLEHSGSGSETPSVGVGNASAMPTGHHPLHPTP